YGADSCALGPGRRDWVALLKPYKLSDLMLVTGLPQRTLSDIRSGLTREPNAESVRRVLDGLPLLDASNPDNIADWREWVPVSALVPALRSASESGSPDDDMQRLRQMRAGKILLRDTERLPVIAAIRANLCDQRSEETGNAQLMSDAEFHDSFRAII